MKWLDCSLRIAYLLVGMALYNPLPSCSTDALCDQHHTAEVVLYLPLAESLLSSLLGWCWGRKRQHQALSLPVGVSSMLVTGNGLSWQVVQCLSTWLVTVSIRQ